MEFRIVPMILVVFNLIFLISINPNINETIALQSVANIPKMAGLSIIFFAMSIGSFLRHSFYSVTFKIAYFLLQLINVVLLIYYIIAIQAQHII
jgi:hypothetical protein